MRTFTLTATPSRRILRRGCSVSTSACKPGPHRGRPLPNHLVGAALCGGLVFRLRPDRRFASFFGIERQRGFVDAQPQLAVLALPERERLVHRHLDALAV